ncbi:MAG TPA: cobalamin-dependent protein [Candidatus Limnocylindrales bacterium]|jgi:excisionase family DNA binding protein
MATETPELLTLHETADRLGVHYMTVYRRVRLGMLPATKVGGQWRVDAADLAGTERAPGGRRARPAGHTPTRTTKTWRTAPWADRLRARMVAGDGAGSWQVVEAAMAAGVDPADVYVEVLGPAMHGIGDAWQRGELGIDQEHLATGVALSIVGRMGPRFRRRGRHLGTVLVAMPTGERHMLGAAMLADILAHAGYEVFNLGADTPPASLARAVAAHDDPRAVVITVVDSARLAAAARLIAAARRVDGGPPVIAGGFAVPDAATARSIGADAWGADPRDLARLIGELGDRRARAG